MLSVLTNANGIPGLSGCRKYFSAPNELDGGAQSPGDKISQAVSLINSYEGTLGGSFKTSLLQIAIGLRKDPTQCSSEPLVIFLEQMISIMDGMLGSEIEKLQTACNLIREHMKEASMLNELHTTAPMDNSKYFDAVAKTFTKYGEQLKNLVSQHQGKIIAMKDSFPQVLLNFDQEIALHIQQIRSVMDKSYDSEITNLFLLLRRRADMHRTFLLALKDIDSQARINNFRLVQRNALAVGAFDITLGCAGFPAVFNNIFEEYPNTKIDIIDPGMRLVKLDIPEILILDIMASYCEGSLLGDSGKEPVAHDIKTVDIPLSKIHLDCLERMMYKILPLASNANFTSVVNKFLECEKLRLNAIEEWNQRNRDTFNTAIEECVKMFQLLPHPLQDFTSIALAPCRLIHLSETN